MAEPRTDAEAAQTGELLTDVLPARKPTTGKVTTGRGRQPGPRGRRVGPTARQPSQGTRGRRTTATKTSVPTLDQAERVALIEELATQLEGLYAHLPLKRAMYAVDPVQRLQLLAQRAGSMREELFHYELARIFTGLRDAHTRYIGPARLAGHVARLPFLVESYGPTSASRYIVSKVARDPALADDRHFGAGVELLSWNAVPIDRAVDLYAENQTGGRPDARRARALESLTFRALQFEPPPDEEWVLISYLDGGGKEREVRIPWRVVRPGRARAARGKRPGRAYAIDRAREAARRAKKLLFAYERWHADQQGTAAPAGPWLPMARDFEDALGARIVRTGSGPMGYLRLWTFDVTDDQAYIGEAMRLLRELEQEEPGGLIIDLRGNPGGLIWAAERLLQLFTPNAITPTRFSLLATRLTRAMAEADQNEGDLGIWHDSLREAVATGEPYSLAFPITPPARCNDIGQVYGGPVVAVVDPNTYSAGDLFAAGFYDNGLGTLLTVGEATGGGGANVWDWKQVSDALSGTAFQRPPLPMGIDVSLSVRRATRGGVETGGAAIEDVGIRGHESYAMTRKDLTGTNQDLLDRCGEVLARRPTTLLKVSRPRSNARTLKVTTRGLDRLDLYVDSRPKLDQDVSDGPTTIHLPQGWTDLELRGFADRELRQCRRFSS